MALDHVNLLILLALKEPRSKNKNKIQAGKIVLSGKCLLSIIKRTHILGPEPRPKNTLTHCGSNEERQEDSQGSLAGQSSEPMPVRDSVSKRKISPCVVHTLNPSNWEAEAVRSL